jgi:hypothetical protein
VGRTWRSTEPGPIENSRTGLLEAPRRYERLVYRGLAEGMINEITAAELLDEDVQIIQLAMKGKVLRTTQS